MRKIYLMIEWRTSLTKLVPKVSKPTVKDLRPIALTNISYKMLMAIIRDKTDDHLDKNNLTIDTQSGGSLPPYPTCAHFLPKLRAKSLFSFLQHFYSNLFIPHFLSLLRYIILLFSPLCK